MAKTQIKDYVFKPGLGAADNLYPDAYNLIERNKSFIQKESASWIQDQIDAEESGFVGYTYNQEKCERDVGLNVDAYLKDLRYGGNENTYNSIKYYWDGNVAQIDGDRQPEIQTYGFIKTLITSYILTNTAYTASNTEVSQVIDTTKTAETGASTKIETLLDDTVAVITNGLSSLPTFEATGVGTIKIQGRWDLDQLLLITNVSKNEIVYNFSNVSTGGLVSLKTDSVSLDEDFSKYLETTDAITTITLNYDTSTHADTDELQIFVEKIENGKSVVTTRPFDFGTDAIERMRVAQPLSMLDADFEYGLQPTKWAAIGTLRGYPSVYEIPGTDTPVQTVVTDASVGTEGVGQSLITVTTVGPHGFESGTPITIKALEDAVVGAARAEGSFVIVEVPTNNTFTYYAKSKVGTTDGDILSTTYTQLRQAGFYTGANIGQPEILVVSNGSAGDIVTELTVNTGENIIPYDGDTPELGSPITDASGSLPLGTQVTGVISNSAGGGTYITPEITNDFPTGATSITVADATGVVQDLAVDRGDGQAIYVTSVSAGPTINFSGEFVTNISGNTVDYIDVSGNNETGTGIDAFFNISRSGGTYSVTITGGGGNGYQVGDRIKILGTELGGISPTHDLVIIVDSIISDGSIETFSTEGTAFDGSATLTGVTGNVEGGQGLNAQFDVTVENNVFTDVTLSNEDSEGYSVNDRIKVTGTNFGINGADGTNDLIVRVTSVDSIGKILTLSFDGTAPDIFNTIVNPPFTSTTVSGTGAQFSVTFDGTTYTDVSFSNAGVNYLPGETITVLGSDLFGSSPANDLEIQIDNVDGSGAITNVSLTGVASNAGAFNDTVSENIIGSGASFDVTLSGGTYTTTLSSAGSNYGAGQVIVISGSDLIGEDVVNDLEITIDTTDAANQDNVGAIATFTETGTAAGGSADYYNVQGLIETPNGSGASFDITRSGGTYSSISLNNIGTDYKVGNRIVIPGSQLGGDDLVHDINIRVLTVDTAGEILTFAESFIGAELGYTLDLISTFTTSEFTTSPLTEGSALSFSEIATLEVTFENAHGLVPGNTFIVDVNSDDGTNNHALASGSFFVTSIPTIDSLQYVARAAGTIDTGTSNDDPIQATVYPRPDSFFIHRPYDGGVQLGTGGPQHGAQAIRQSKKYIRYQSGKGIMYTTGALFAPSYDLRSVTAEDVEVGSLITVVTDDNDHGVQEGGIVRLLGIETPGYNSGPETRTPPQFDYEVVNVIDERTYQVRAQRRLGSTDAVLGFGSQMSVVSWHGATVRSGIFDDQNGIFWEFDGTQISVVQRTGTRQLAGTISIDVDRNLVTGVNTRFEDQLKAGDRIIIKGMTHVVSHVNGQSEMTVTPDWRGVVNITGAKANLIVDKKTKQEDFNLDRLDGTGPSGYDIDIAKMQMIGIQYSWYGAGFIDFMLRGADGNFVYAHRMRNSNINTEAFMRSGNLPVRYEVSNEGPSGKLAEQLDAISTSLTLEDSSFFPEYGTLYIDNEIITYNGKDDSTNQLLNLVRGATYSNFQAGATRTYSAGGATIHSARTGVILISQTITPLISHWGSAFITDGMFDEDRGYIFSYAETGIAVSTTKQTAFLIRLSPSVSNALVGDLGERELLNRAQLLLQGLEVTSDGNDGTNDILGGIVIEGILNPQNYPLNPDDIGWTTLSGVAQGGQPSFAQVASGGSVVWSTGETATTATVTAQSQINIQLNSGLYNRGGNTNFIWVSATDYRNTFGSNDTSFVIGNEITGSAFRANTFITDSYIDPNSNYGWFRLSRNTQSFIAANTPDAYTIIEGGDLENRNFALFNKTSFDSAGAAVGTDVTSGGSVSFPSNTLVNRVELKDFGGVEYYEVQFNNSFSGTLAAGTGTVEFTFQQPPYAQPGETVFSFIANPGERSTLDLSELKELTNTPLGGRGTFPNGPDVLAINVYKVSGTDVPANIILRWGEAQA